MKTVILPALFLVILFVIKTENAKVSYRDLHFDNRKMYRVIPKSEEDLTFINKLRSINFGKVFWNKIENIGEPVHSLTTPSLIEELRQKYPNVNWELIEVHSKVTIAMSQTHEKKSVASECENTETQPMANNENTLALMNRINGTDLYTGVYYKVGMKRFPHGWITWTAEPDTGEAHFWQIDFNADTSSLYETGGPYENDNQWTFGETELPGWYTLANRGVAKGFATWSNTKLNSGNALVVTSTPTDLERLSPGGQSRNNAFWTPVATNENNFYQLALKSVPKGKVTWSYAKHDNYSHYMIVATKEEDMNFYRPGNKWYDDTLFHIELGSELILEGTLFDFQFGGRLDENLKQYNNEVDSISTVVNQFIIPNKRYGNEINEAIIKMKSPLALKFEEDFFDFISKIKTDIFDANGCQELKCEKGGLCRKATVTSTNIKTKINIPTNSKNAGDIPFIAKMKIVGKTERLFADGSGNVELGIVPGEFIERFFKSKSRKFEIVDREDKAMIVEVRGKLSGFFQ